MLFSIIVPIYGVEPYLRECLDSIVNQEFKDFEAILVDDGSKDNCGIICDEYAERDKRFKVIHKENGGLVSARKAGIKEASGEYIINFDSDDILSPRMLQGAYEIISQHNPQMISFALEYFNDDIRKTVKENIGTGLYDENKIQTDILPRILMREDMEHMFYYLCGKAIKRELVYKNQMNVSEKISLGEDVSCVIPTYLECTSLYVSDEVMYYVRMREGSDSRSFKIKQYEQLSHGIELLEKTEDKKGAGLTEQIHRYVSFICFGILNGAAATGFERYLGEIVGYMNKPIFRKHIAAAKFNGVTPKMKIVYSLFRKNRIKTAYWFLWLCNRIKKNVV